MIKMIIDTDGVADDIRAISLALQHPNVEIPIYKGAELPLIGNGHNHLDEVPFFGSDGCGNAKDDFPKSRESDFEAYEQDKHASVFLYEHLSKHRDITLVCIGPLTNVALALKLDPNFATYPKKMVIMGGNVYGAGNVRSWSTAEFNFSNDPEAAHIVLKEMQCPIIQVPWETFLFEFDFHAHLELNIPLAKYFRTITKFGIEMLKETDKQYSYCDEIAVGVAIESENLIDEKKIMRGTVELHGQIALDWTEALWSSEAENPKLCRKRHPITFVTKYNVKYLDKMVFDAIYNSEKNPVQD